ncbi:hypothetical protein GQ44DRAFT_646673 [Phaeosphaeriaceae sp. PMI808]|nr:hypothetical protein GQ44DRAFT_646673 [Phaeosphaeriaceae sp. PMI808]
MPPKSLTMDLVKRPKTGQKVRTGCLTCKIRRVKCGEEKPYCLRCTSTGRKCDGYAQNLEVDKAKKSDAKRELGSFRVVSTHQVLGDNIQYLEFYHRCTGPTIATDFDKEFWTRTPLQLAQSELSIRHALIALSYINKTEDGSLKDARSGLIAANNQKTMLIHYNKAVTSLVKRMPEASYTPEIGLVCCLIFICLEFHRGNYDTAMEHFKSGLNIISAYKRSQASSNAKTPSEDLIEKSLIPMFTRMMATGIMFGLPTEHVFYTTCYPVGTQEYVFKSLKEAQSSMHHIRNMALILFRRFGHRMVEQTAHTIEELQSQKECVEHHHVWLRALERLEREQPLTTEDAVTVNLLKAQHYIMYIFIARALLQKQTEFDQHLEDFKAVIKHSKVYIDAMDNATSVPAANFTLDMTVILGLYMAACRCRCPTTRREAVSLLERNLPREGLWDAKQHLIVAKRVIELEESELDPITGWPAEQARIWSTMIHGSVDGNGRFPVYFVIGKWGEGRGVPPLPPGLFMPHDPEGKIWKEWFVL